MNPNQTQQLDQDVVNLTKAIRQVESGGKADARGASGEYGGYQFMPDTWKAYAAEAGINVPLEQATRQQQNQVAYNKIKQWKDAGHNIGEVASMWNAGPGRPDAYRTNWRGVNDQGVEYDTPAYAQKVAEAYQQIKRGGGTTGPINYPTTPPKQDFTAPESGFMDKLNAMEAQAGLTGKEGGFFSDVGQSFRDFGTNLNTAVTEDQNIGSKGLQAVGAIGQGIGDLTDDALSNVPVVGKGYEWLTEKLGEAIGGAAEATGLVDWFAQQSPEAQRNMEAALNAASIIPLFKAFSLAKTGVRDATTTALKSKFEQKAIGEIEQAMTTQKNRRIVDNANSRGLDPIGTIVRTPEYLPDKVNINGRWEWDTREASAAAQRNIDVKERALQNLLDSTAATQAAGIPLATVRATVLKDVLGGRRAISNRRWEGKINEIFDDIQYGYGSDYISLSDLNQIKRQVREAIDYDSPNPFKNPLRDLDDEIQSSIRKQVEDYGKKAGIKDIAEINQAMAKDITVKKVLDMLGDGKAIKDGAPSIGGALMNTATFGAIKPLVDYRKAKLGPSTATSRLKERRPLGQTMRKAAGRAAAGLVGTGQL